ncbi:hypothetical protein DFJ73DRAFT_360686 [Zopfochytrium polystomum]|nr:hypothetical protein DFJ73DRAFT_360686 [Zopfochytrium polystomum]
MAIVFTVLFLLRRNHPEIVPGGVSLSVVEAVCGLGLSWIFVTYTTVPFPGAVFFWGTSLLFLCFLGCIVGRAVRLYLLFRWNQEQLNRMSNDEGIEPNAVGAGGFSPNKVGSFGIVRKDGDEWLVPMDQGSISGAGRNMRAQFAQLTARLKSTGVDPLSFTTTANGAATTTVVTFTRNTPGGGGGSNPGSPTTPSTPTLGGTPRSQISPYSVLSPPANALAAVGRSPSGFDAGFPPPLDWQQRQYGSNNRYSPGNSINNRPPISPVSPYGSVGGPNDYGLVPMGNSRVATHGPVSASGNAAKSNPTRRIERSIWTCLGIALCVQVASNTLLQIMFPGPVSFRLTVSSEGSTQEIFRIHLISTYLSIGLFLSGAVPYLLYLLKDVKDANGLKLSLVAQLIVSVPSFVLWFVFIFFIKNLNSHPAFPASLFPIFCCLASLSTAIVVPVVKTVASDYRRNVMSRDPSSNVYLPLQSSEAWADGSSWSVQPAPSTKAQFSFSALFHQLRRPATDGGAGSAEYALPRGTTAVSPAVSAFNRALASPETAAKFRAFCARDFNIEAALLHHSLLFLRSAVDGIEAAVGGGGGGGGGSGTVGLVRNVELSVDDWIAARTPQGRKTRYRLDGSENAEAHTVTIIGDVRAAVVGQCIYVAQTFIAPGGQLEVSYLRESTRRAVLDRLDAGRFRSDMFDAVMAETIEFLVANVYPKFLNESKGHRH